MAQENTDQKQQLANLCRAGCGFFGNDAFEGMCSKCYKDYVKRNSSAANSSPAPPAMETVSTLDPCGKIPLLPDVKTAQPTVLSTDNSKAVDSSQSDATSSSGLEDNSDSSAKDEKKPIKKNRCGVCKKKLGLTGFDCRCGGLFCSQHRYANEHQCRFDYKEHGANQIAKDNPKVVTPKIGQI